jgi:hypothetical protein
VAEDLTREEADLEAFFRCGDDGTYAGGPSASLPPVFTELQDEVTEPGFEAAIAQRLERRARYQQRVTRVIGVLGVAAVLAVTLRTAVRNGEPVAAATPPIERLPPPAAPLPPAPEPLIAVAPVPGAAAPPAPEATPPASEPVAARAESSDHQKRRAAEPRPQIARARKKAEPQIAQARTSFVPRGSASFPSSSSGHGSHSPPTANFPD